MKCPACKDVVLAAAEADASLPSRRCGRCGGQWVASAAYFKWLEERGSNLPEQSPQGEVEVGAAEPAGRAKLCPECGRFLARARVGHGVRFQLERCAGCGGIWFDADEWDALKARGLHDDVHFVFSSAWQADVARRERDAAHERLMAQKLGEADWTEVKRIRAWLEGHPKRSELYAALTWDVAPQPADATDEKPDDGPH